MRSLRKILTVAGLAALVFSQGAAGVQEMTREERRALERQLQEMRQEMRELERQLGSQRVEELNRLRVQLRGVPNVVAMESNRARLGVEVNVNRDDENDRLGALLTNVFPGTGADEAGLRAGDIIVSVDGERLGGQRREVAPDESAPGRKLIDLIRNYESGDEIEVEYLRDGETGTATVLLGRNDDSFGGSWRVLRELGEGGVVSRSFEPLIPMGDAPGRGFSVLLAVHEAWSDLELVELNEELGRYFGTNEGLLVIQPPEDETLGLQAGDVILEIGTREARTPSRAMRLLRSYEPGERVIITIMRDRNRRNVEFVMPERNDEDGWGEMGWNFRGNGFGVLTKPGN